MTGGHAWLGACITGSMHGTGCAWQGDMCGGGGACVAGGGMHGWGHAW